MEDNKKTVRAFLKHFLRGYELGDDEEIFSLGFVNSMFAMELIMFIENEFKVKVESEDLDLKNFNTINSIDGLLARKCGQGLAA